MEFTIQYEQALDCVVCSTQGPFEIETLAGAIADIVSHLEEHRSANLLGDHSESSLDTLSTNQIQKISSLALSMAGALEGKKFAVIFGDDLAFGLGRMWQTYTKGKAPFMIETFKTRERAIRWLNDDLEPGSD